MSPLSINIFIIDRIHANESIISVIIVRETTVDEIVVFDDFKLLATSQTQLSAFYLSSG